MIIDIFLILYTLLLGLVALFYGWAALCMLRHKVPSISTPAAIQRQMIEAARLKPGQIVCDLGCGTGRLLLHAHRVQPKAIYTGYDVFRPALWWAKFKNRALNARIQFIVGDFFRQDLSQADVIFCYLWPSIMDQIESDIWPTLKPGAVLISYAFPMKNVSSNPNLISKIFVYQKLS